MKDWVRTKLLAGAHTRQIIKEHYRNSFLKIQAGTADRDCFLTSQDVRNISSKLDQHTWKLHPNEAQSVRLFYEQHASNVFRPEQGRLYPGSQRRSAEFLRQV